MLFHFVFLGKVGGVFVDLCLVFSRLFADLIGSISSTLHHAPSGFSESVPNLISYLLCFFLGFKEIRSFVKGFTEQLSIFDHSFVKVLMTVDPLFLVKSFVSVVVFLPLEN